MKLTLSCPSVQSLGVPRPNFNLQFAEIGRWFPAIRDPKLLTIILPTNNSHFYHQTY
jgi:hypothetical protein